MTLGGFHLVLNLAAMMQTNIAKLEGRRFHKSTNNPCRGIEPDAAADVASPESRVFMNLRSLSASAADCSARSLLADCACSG